MSGGLALGLRVPKGARHFGVDDVLTKSGLMGDRLDPARSIASRRTSFSVARFSSSASSLASSASS
jgi:hypothetical protein